MKTTTKSVLLASLLVSTFGMMSAAHAADAAVTAPAAEAASPHTFTSNIGFFTDYVFRGVSYGRERGAVQGGFDYAHASGLYAGVWATNVEKDALYGNTVELDLYGGYLHQINPDLALNVGFLQFYYPNNIKSSGGGSANTTELNAAVTYKWLTLKHSYAVTDFFGYNETTMANYGLTGTGNTKGSGYTELNFNYKLPVQDINLALHVGHQRVENYKALNYTDYLIGFNKDFAVGASTGWNGGVNFTTTNADDAIYVYGSGYKTADTKVVGFIKRTF